MDKKICFIASTGGHYEQIMILKPIMKKYNSFIVTEKTKYNCKVDGVKSYYVMQVNRKEIMFILKMIINSFKSLYIFLRERPDVVITTGALSVIPLCLLSKLFRKKMIFIESFAKISSPTLTGKLLYKFADEFYIQWEELKKYYPKAIYKGGIY